MLCDWCMLVPMFRDNLTQLMITERDTALMSIKTCPIKLTTNSSLQATYFAKKVMKKRAY